VIAPDAEAGFFSRLLYQKKTLLSITNFEPARRYAVMRTMNKQA
jgi:hypothetical protein